MKLNQLNINGRSVGPGESVFVVAEMSANHLGDYEHAARIVQAAAEAGADAIKLQTYTPDTMTLDSPQEHFRIKGSLWEGRTLYDLYREAAMPWDWQPRLKKLAESLGLSLFSTPFDASSVCFLEQMKVPCHKIASFELVDIPLIKTVAATGKPVIMSTGMASITDIQEAVDAFRSAGGGDLALLKCTSAYPAPSEAANLLTMVDMASRFNVPVGISDHTLESVVAVAAVALGACIVEKHLTLLRADGGPDAAFSMEPQEFGAMIQSIRAAEAALGEVRYGVTSSQTAGRAYRRSLFIVEDIKAGEPFTRQNVRSIRPSDGLHPRYHDRLLGRHAAKDAKRGTPLSWDMVEGDLDYSE